MHQPLPLGTILNNRYYLIDLLAQGKYKRTYLAKDLQSSNELRSLLEFTLEQTDTADIQQILANLQAKAEKLYRIQHPQIRQLYEIFAQEQRLFFVQEFVEGKSCHTLLQERLAVLSSFLQEEVWQLLLMLLPALEYLHSIGMSHGNISPETIILSACLKKQKSPIPILIDLAAEKELQNQIIESAKEKEEPRAKTQPSPSSDLYSLAVTAVILLTGKEKAELIENGEIRKNWQRQTTVSPALARILNRMLSDNPKQRYSSAKEVAKELQALAALTTYKQKPKNQPQYFWAYAISLSLVLVVGIGSWAVLYYLLSPLSISPSAKSLKPDATGRNTRQNEKPVIFRQMLEAVPDKTVRVGGNLKENETILYVISAKQWQTLTAAVEGEGVLMRVLNPNQKPMPGSFQPIQRWEGGLFSPGNYMIELNSKPGAAQIEYKLEVRLAKYFPQKFCEDPSASSEGKWYPVLVPYKAETLNRLQAQFCRNTVVVLKDGGVVQVQVGSFGERSRAEAFASAIKSTSGTVEVGEPFVGSPRRSCTETPEDGKLPQYQVFTEYAKEKYIRILSYCPNASVRKRPDLSGSFYIEVAAFAEKSKAEAMAALISREVGSAEVGEILTQVTNESRGN
ncbi:MAG: protein kinase [Oscillatoriaceae bacterium SKW80]|nr:protein kinase [Oscillatoriaceae bacterium SKYG93]MCX8121726.1 protein kinase [Oscillatoriaceae bacterium SKW80]MDW8453658.1 protein kinase [Oscillatoriaceae cyanobacterium SKYGB_i_bin93]HIK28723.1 protein kinase [Oscillatoriaceae cyanobacterium M7585_C2015_266]